MVQFRLGGFDNLAVVAEVGGDYGVIWGTKYKRVEDETSSSFGKIIVDSDGLPEADSEKTVLGSQQPDALLGITNTFSYKFKFHIWFLNRMHVWCLGEIFSGTNQTFQASGNAAVTVVKWPKMRTLCLMAL